MSSQSPQAEPVASGLPSQTAVFTPTPEGAHRIADQITMEARRFGYPLLCRPVSIGP